MGEKWLCRSDSPQVEGWGRVCVHGLTTALELGYQLCSIGESFTMKETVSGGFGRNQKTATTLSAPHIPPLYLLAFLSIGSTLLASGSSCLFEYSSFLVDRGTVKGQQDRGLGAFLTMNKNNIEPLSTKHGAK